MTGIIIMASLLDAIKAAASLNEERVEPKSAPKSAPKAAPKKPEKKAAATKTDTSKAKGGALYVIPAEFKKSIEDYLSRRHDMATKLKQKGKSIDGCCDYIFGVMLKRAKKARKNESAVGLYADPQEVFGLAVHYYDESDEELKKEQ